MIVVVIAPQFVLGNVLLASHEKNLVNVAHGRSRQEVANVELIA
jgi:hypothetical protein